MLAVDDAMYNRFSSAHAVWSVLEKRFAGPEKVLEFFLSKSVGISKYTHYPTGILPAAEDAPA